MERIKSALDKARLERERLARKSLARQTETMEPSSSDISDTEQDNHTHAIFSRPPFSHCTSEQQQALLRDGFLMHVNKGETFQFAGEIDGYIHYLLSGVVVIESDDEPRTEMSASKSAEIVALNKAGLKTRTLTASTDVDIFRIAQSSVPNMAQYSSDEPLPKSLYTETQSGQDLAELVDRLNSEEQANQAPGDKTKTEVPLGENTLGFNFNVDDLQENSADHQEFLSAVSQLAAPQTDQEIGYQPEFDDEIGRFAKQLDNQFRDYVEKVRAEERDRYEHLLERHATKLKHAAENKLREKVKLVRDRYHAAYGNKEQLLSQRLERMREFADQITRQKAAIYEARRELAEKLAEAGRLHRELSSLGDQVDVQLNKLDTLMPSPEEMGGEDS